MQFLYPKRLEKSRRMVDAWVENNFSEWLENDFVNAPEEVKKAFNDLKNWRDKNLPKFGN